MQPLLPENSDEITLFIIEGTHRLATISINDYGFLLSARMAQTYLDRATQILGSIRKFDSALHTEINLLKVTAKAIAHEYAQFETFCRDCERFDHLKPKIGLSGLPNVPFAQSPRAIAKQSAIILRTRFAAFTQGCVQF